MKTKLVNKDIKENYTIELLKERGLNEEEINYFLNVPDDKYLINPAKLHNITPGYLAFLEMKDLTANDRIVVVVD